VTETHLGDRNASDDLNLVARLRAGDERAFESLVVRHYATMFAVARTYVQSRSVAEEVVQEAWLGLLQSLDRFEARSSLKTWVIAIVANKAKTRAKRERRTIPFASMAREDEEPAVDPDRFRTSAEPYPGHWRGSPSNWGASPETVLQDRETMRAAMRAIAELPPAQQTVIRMRDVEGYSADEVCTALELSQANQRVLLHRARARVRTALEQHLDA
jgi:RNA polymerase sigma-70 factor, ECF subfamily